MSKIEKEIRFYFPTSQLKTWQQNLKHAKYNGRFHELTVMYDHPDADRTFYSNSVDGRLRLRYATPTDEEPDLESSGLVTWKQRMPDSLIGHVRNEKEIEFSFNPTEADEVRAIFEDVLDCKRISSYERYRSYYQHDDVQITVDEFPFGLMVEFEFDDSAEENVQDVINKYGVSINDASALSCDDKYFSLCNRDNLAPKPDIEFSDKDMPKI